MTDHPVLSFEREDQLFASIRVSSDRPPLDLDTLRELLVQADEQIGGAEREPFL